MTQEELIDKLLEAANTIHKKSISNTNWLIVSSQVAEAIENLDIKKQRRKKLDQINKRASE